MIHHQILSIISLIMRQAENLPKDLKGYLTTTLGSVRISYHSLQRLLKGPRKIPNQSQRNQEFDEEWLSRKRTRNQTFFSLWPELSENPKRRRKNQGTSHFLELPFEIREEIFRLAIGMELFHIIDMASRTGYILCGGPHLSKGSSYWQQKTCNRNCASPLWSLVSYRSTPTFHRSSGFPALLLTCRQNYTQGVGVLYSSNVFEAEYPETIVSLSNCIRPSLLQTIRFLQIGGRARVLNVSTGIDKDWDAMWEVICHQMKALRSLQVRLRIQLQNSRGQYDIWSDRAYAKLREWLAIPVENLRGLKHFNLIVDAPAADDRLLSFQDKLELLICSSISKGTPNQFPELFNRNDLIDVQTLWGQSTGQAFQTTYGPAYSYDN